MHSRFKWFFIVALVVGTLLYPGYVFGAIGIVVLLIILFLIIVDVVADVYIVVAMMIEKFRGK